MTEVYLCNVKKNSEKSMNKIPTERYANPKNDNLFPSLEDFVIKIPFSTPYLVELNSNSNYYYQQLFYKIHVLVVH